MTIMLTLSEQMLWQIKRTEREVKFQNASVTIEEYSRDRAKVEKSWLSEIRNASIAEEKETEKDNNEDW